MITFFAIRKKCWLNRWFLGKREHVVKILQDKFSLSDIWKLRANKLLSQCLMTLRMGARTSFGVSWKNNAINNKFKVGDLWEFNSHQYQVSESIFWEAWYWWLLINSPKSFTLNMWFMTLIALFFHEALNDVWAPIRSAIKCGSEAYWLVESKYQRDKTYIRLKSLDTMFRFPFHKRQTLYGHD